MKRGMRAWTGLAALLALAVGAGGADAQWTRTDDAGCEDRWGGRDRDRFCMVLEGEFDDAGRVVLDGGMNGGVQVEGWSRSGVEVRAKVWANARSAERAREIADDVRVSMRDGRLRADGPDTGRNESWGVSWEVTVPYETDLDIETMNGGIGVTDVRGDIVFRAQNGGVHLAGLGGDVSGRTTNGGVHVELMKDAGMDVGTRFAVREGSRTIGAGMITEVS